MESNSEEEEDSADENDEVEVEVGQTSPSLGLKDRITGQQLNYIQVSEITCKQNNNKKNHRLCCFIFWDFITRLFYCQTCFYACPADGAEGVPPKVGRRAQSSTKSRVKAYGGSYIFRIGLQPVSGFLLFFH